MKMAGTDTVWKILRIPAFALCFVVVSTCAQGQLVAFRKVFVKKDVLVILMDTSYITRVDTTLYLSFTQLATFKTRPSPYLTSSLFFDSLKMKSSNRKVTRGLYSLFVKRKKRPEKLTDIIIKSEDVFKPFAGFRIASISFQTVDLLEGSVTDTLQSATTRVGKWVNRLHKDTRASIVAQNLLFQVGDFVDPFTFADNERLLREFIAIRDARIYLRANSDNSHEVDVVVVTQDVSSIGVSGTLGSFEKFRFDLYDKNILGYARQLRISYYKNTNADKAHGFEVALRDPNFFGSFLQGEIQYTNNYLRQRTKLALGRDFFTPAIKYAGGVELYRTKENFYFEDYDTLEMPYAENAIDAWAGRSFVLTKRRNLIFTSRINTREFTSKPFVSPDSNSFFFSRTFFLGGLSLTQRNFLKSQRIRGFGRTEDVPVGGVITFISGQEINEFSDRYYMEWNGSMGKYLSRVGYFNIAFAAGTFYKLHRAEDGLLTIRGTYFSHLVKVGKTQVRQFFFSSYTNGYNRILDETLRLTGKWRDAERFSPLGNQRLAMGFETVYFMPWYFYGFQFALFHRVDINLLSMDARLFSSQSALASVRIGMRTLNEYLTLPLFSFEVTYFGNNQTFTGGWEVRVSTSMPRLFISAPTFKPIVALFD